MTWAVLGWDGEDGAARRQRVRDRHLALLRDWASDGRLLLGVPLFDATWQVRGSLMLIDGDAAVREAYLAAEPFATEGVWTRTEVHPFRIAPLPYRPLVAPDAPVPYARTHTVIVAWDGRDPAASERRLAARQAHMERVAPMAGDGLLALGGAILDAPEGRMIGSIALLRLATDDEADAWMAADPYGTGGVWQERALWGTRLAPLPYRALPGAVAAR